MISCKKIDYVTDFLNMDYLKANVYEDPVIDYLGILFSSPGEVSISIGSMVAKFLHGTSCRR